jgi:hypothetical protein
VSIRPVSFVVLAVGAATCLGACSSDRDSVGTDPSGADTIDFGVVSRVLLERLDLQAGERTLLVGAPGRCDPLVPLLRAGVADAGAVDLGAWAVEGEPPDSWSSDFTRELSAVPDDGLVSALTDVDAAVMLPGSTASHPVYAALQDVLRLERGRTVHFHWLGA